MEETHWSYAENMDAGGLRELMRLYGSEVWNLAFVLTKRRDLADDVSQDVFFAAYRKIDTFRGASSVRTWLLSITRNVRDPGYAVVGRRSGMDAHAKVHQSRRRMGSVR
ncbi:sigma factor [Cohnella sp. GCM10012308]|uniref:sigma factor n=1 Tax=Cohnella sp. GCM10012308 TaxID=3317329 RepID=UPI003611C1D8